ncbi:oxidoreductase,short chain dehydrogenase-like protein [Ophiobolus disseminans]|uniref:Oxidoreductase,short chain dehydrogenase-like protein n=1 Tax=Ophiobolus disseminans TaxID=1469910 RepID=A0A6A6ZSX8_9PLEO|nr:oxidoreductase,short chain dehydrogenase-like protein [Ophiobolus disseminans]
MTPQVWLITGTSSGFGAAFVHSLLARGDKVIATARTLSKISNLKDAGASILQLDVTSSPKALQKTVQEAVAIYGRIDVLVNNAGYSHFGTFEDATPKDWQSQFDTNLFGAINVSRAFLPHFRANKAGVIVFIGSAAALCGMPTLALYCGSKWALTGAAESLNEEVKSFGIHTLIVQPGFFRTELLNANNTTYVETKISDYEPLVNGNFEIFRGANGVQPGDPRKGAERIIDTVKGEGLAKGKKLPQTLYLGSDVIDQAKKRAEATLELLKEWEEIGSNLDV